MSLDRELSVHLGWTAEGLIAGTNVSPFFCFEAPTQEALTDKVRSALRFYAQHKNAPPSRHAAMSNTIRQPIADTVISSARVLEAAL